MARESNQQFTFFLSALFYTAPREELFETIRPFFEPKLQPMHTFDQNSLIEILLRGHEDLSSLQNKGILSATIGFIRKTERFD